MKKYTVENTSRQVIRLQAVRPGPKGKGPVRDMDHDVVIGDAADTDQDLKLRGIERNPKCPTPRVEITDVDLARLAPSSRSAFDAWRANGTLRVTEYEAA